MEGYRRFLSQHKVSPLDTLWATHRYLLTVSKDRQLCLFAKTDSGAAELAEGGTPVPPYQLLSAVKAHKRIVWSCSWAPDDKFFATGTMT